MIKMIAVTAAGGINDITAHTGNYSRSDNIDSLGMEFTFDFLNNSAFDAVESWDELPIGSKIIVSNNGTTIFQGVVISYTRDSVSRYKYKAYDYAYYLNKSESVIQFNNISAKQALEQLCSQESIPVEIACDLPTVVSKIYNGEKISSIIDDLLKLASDETGLKYRREFNNGKLLIDKRTNLVIQAEYKPAKGESSFDPATLVGSFNSDYSAEDMCNRVVIISSSEKNQQVMAEVSDSSSISTYGQLTHYEKLDDKQSSQAQEIAKKKLKDLNRIKRSFKVTLFGDDAVRSGRCLVFNQPEIDLTGTFLIKNCTHTYNGSAHFMELELKMEAE